MDDLLFFGGGALITGGIAKILCDLRKTKREKRPLSTLDEPVLYWTPKDPWSVRSLLESVVIFGRTGSGKTSSSNKLLLDSIVSHPRSAVLGLAAKPEDVEMWVKTYRKWGKELIVFDAQSPWRFNLLDGLGHGEPRSAVQGILTVGETLRRGEGKGSEENGRFWEGLKERILYCDVIALRGAREPISADKMQALLMTAATDPKMLTTDEWKSQYCNRVLSKAAGMKREPIEEHDFKLALSFFVKEFPTMDPKVRSNGLADVMNILHVFNTGIVREMIGGKTNCSPADILNGKSILVNFPPSKWGAAGSFINAAWKYATQLAILERRATEGSPFCMIHCDEAHQFVNTFDSHFIAQCRSHKGCLLYLSQSVSSFYAAMKGEAGKHQADALLANFSTWIVHACDPVTAKVCVSMLGHEIKRRNSGGMSPPRNENFLDEMAGNNYGVNMGWGDQREPVLDESRFMTGRTGGPEFDYMADAIILRSGMPFSNGKQYLHCAFSQK